MTIIRETRLDDGSDGWLLISQVEHARVSGEIAAAWRESVEVVPRQVIVETAFHHDDGWAEWEKMPGVDASTGRPYAFTEMPDDAKYEIWAKSIDAGREIGPLAGAIVAWHFMALLTGTNGWQETEETVDGAREFVETYAASAETWLGEWMAQDRGNDRTAAQTALEWLQMLDAVSLWLSMAERREAIAFDVPGGGQIWMRPQTARRIEVDPWPLIAREVELEIAGQQVPARRYADAADLASEMGCVQRLCWVLVPQ